MAASANIIQIELRIGRVGPGTTGVLVESEASNNPGMGTATPPVPIMMPMAQMVYLQDAEIVPGTDGAITLANINTALAAATLTLAGATGTPKITPAILAQINAWASGSP
jgi:hypothetical protein